MLKAFINTAREGFALRAKALRQHLLQYNDQN